MNRREAIRALLVTFAVTTALARTALALEERPATQMELLERAIDRAQQAMLDNIIETGHPYWDRPNGSSDSKWTHKEVSAIFQVCK